MKRAYKELLGKSETLTLEELIDFLGIKGTKKEHLSEATYYACLKVLSESIGKLPLNEEKFDCIYSDIVDYGFDFYAPQVFANENILMAWLNMWDRNNPAQKYGFAGQLTVPRKIEIVNNRL